MIDALMLRELCSTLNVLYVEDDISIQTFMLRYLEKFFSSVVVANNGQEGLQAYQKESFDIVITDLSMPVMNGFDMITEIKKIKPDQSILITTAHSESDYMFSAIKIGIDGYIIKPFEYEQLNQELYKITDKLKQYKENEEYKNHLSEMVEARTKELQNALSFQIQNYDETLHAMVEMIEERDTYTAGHSKRVATYSKMIACEMGYGEEECLKIYQAGILHDVGKVATPDAILLNPKGLNEIEYKLIKEHVVISYKLLNSIPMFKELAEIVYSHHERYDGEGYPQGLKGEDVPPLSRIMIVADAFDAMTTSRIYQARKGVKEALAELESFTYKQFHPEVVKAAVEVLKDIHIDKNISQVPTTQIEKERFAYFYKDILCDVYNESYLDLVLAKNGVQEDDYKFLYFLEFKRFSQFNKTYGWGRGNEFLKTIAKLLKETFQKSLVFRIFGDDFVILSREELNTPMIQEKVKEHLKEELDYTLQEIRLQDRNIKHIEELL
ncbi:response regulator [bacterium]|nr:response regulator [bacterium]MBU1883143.1 response regulator [bacterium]